MTNWSRHIVALLDHIPGGAELKAKLDDGKKAQLTAAMPGLKERAKTLLELIDNAGYLFASRPLAPDEKAAALLDRSPERPRSPICCRASSRAAGRGPPPPPRKSSAPMPTETGLKLGKVAQPLQSRCHGAHDFAADLRRARRCLAATRRSAASAMRWPVEQNRKPFGKCIDPAPARHRGGVFTSLRGGYVGQAEVFACPTHARQKRLASGEKAHRNNNSHPAPARFRSLQPKWQV